MEGARVAQEYFQSAFGRNILGRTRIVYTTESSPFTLGQSAVTSSGTHLVTFYPPGWSWQGTLLVRIVVHELFHILQGEVNWPGTGAIPGLAPDLPGVRWLSEGSAEYVAIRALSDRGLYSLSNEMRIQQLGVCAQKPPSLRHLEELNAFYTAPSSYGLAAIGVEMLMGGDLRKLVAYWNAARTMDWREALVPAFGLTVNDFYTRLEERTVQACR